MTRLAVVTSEEGFAERLGGNFEAHRVAPEHCLDGDDEPADAYLVDAHTGERFDLVARLATETRRPIVVMVRGASHGLAARYLEFGADAVVEASAPIEECVARLRALTRRAALGGSGERVLRAGPVTIFPDSRRVEVAGAAVRLTRTEFNLLLALAEHIDEVVTHRKLMSDVWGPEYVSARHYLRVYVRRLREKIEADPDRPAVLVSDRGRGYMLRSRPAEAPQGVAAGPRLEPLFT